MSTVGFIRRRLVVAAVKAQCHSLLGRLKGMGPGEDSAANRRRSAAEQERLWIRERRTFALATMQSYNIIRIIIIELWCFSCYLSIYIH